ncbi:MAG: alpha/beta hydrolase [Pseudomonadota bacterium]|jgi:acetyl esterase/lipase
MDRRLFRDIDRYGARYPAAAQFRQDAVSEETHTINREVAQRLAAVNSAAVDAASLRRAFARGDGPIPATAPSPRARLMHAPGPAGRLVPLRVIAPAVPRGVYLHMHGGGWMLGSADMRDGDMERLVEALGVACVSVDYRLAPEHPYPAAPDDCEAAARWLIAHAEPLFGTDCLLIGGESAGAHLAAVTLLRLRDAGLGDAFASANLAFGAYDLSMTPSQLRGGSAKAVTTRRVGERIGEAFLPADIDRRHPDVSPLYADLAGLPPALFSVGTLDQLLDDSLFMHARWVAAGNPAELAVYPGGVHGFTAMGGELAEAAHQRMERFLQAALPRVDVRAATADTPMAAAVDRLLRMGVHM